MWSRKQTDTSESILDDDVFPLDVCEHPLPEVTVMFRLFAALFHQSLCPSLATDEQGVVVQRTCPETGHPCQDRHEQGDCGLVNTPWNRSPMSKQAWTGGLWSSEHTLKQVTLVKTGLNKYSVKVEWFRSGNFQDNSNIQDSYSTPTSIFAYMHTYTSYTFAHMPIVYIDNTFACMHKYASYTHANTHLYACTHIHHIYTLTHNDMYAHIIHVHFHTHTHHTYTLSTHSYTPYIYAYTYTHMCVNIHTSKHMLTNITNTHKCHT